MLITKTVLIKWHWKNKEYYVSKGYSFTKIGDEFEVKVEDLLPKAQVYVEVKCDCNDCVTPINKPIKYENYTRYVKEDGSYYCKRCASNLYGNKNMALTKLKNNGKSFEQWCIDNNRQDVLDRWDYELNNCSPNNIGYSTNIRYYFKCQRGIHKSELKNVNSFTSGYNGSINCKQCGSFAQWGIDNIDKNFLEKYWDYNKNTVNPWEISKRTKINNIWVYCQDVNYHESYLITPDNFYKGQRCSFCKGDNIVHPLDSIGKLLEDKGLLHLWSDKNKKSPYEYSQHSNQDVYWECPDKKHEEYKRDINHSNTYNFRCPECQYSKGEERISNYLIDKGFSKIEQKDFNLKNDINKYSKDYYIPQKEFDGLTGLGSGLLLYDFYLPSCNLLIEYDGEYHFKLIKYYKNEPVKYAEERFKKQQEHDRRKNEYAKINNIRLLRIPYWEFDNIEEILENNIK